MNYTFLIGRTTREIELKQTQSGISVISFTVAVNRKYKTESGETEADFINCIAWRERAETLAKYVKKGDRIALVGELQTRTYQTTSGENRYVTEVVVNDFEFLEPKKVEPTADTKKVEPENDLPF